MILSDEEIDRQHRALYEAVRNIISGMMDEGYPKEDIKIIGKKLQGHVGKYVNYTLNDEELVFNH
tara:strand:+ start:372 stop:566 length:195 start_codon:yes stop_codon:yes gene_type:complete